MKSFNFNKIFSNELLYSSLGFLAPIPFFLIPSFNILYLNPIKNYKNLDYIIHPDYTYSLGLAVPINLFLLFLCFVSLKIGENNFKKNDFLYPLIVAPYYLITSNSIKSFAFIASLYSFIMINYLCTSSLGRLFLISYTRGFSFFIFCHAISLFCYGSEFAYKTEGISIFGFEIYQALISYPPSIAAFFGISLMAPKSMRIILFKYSLKLVSFLAFAFLLLCTLYILSILSRRASLIVISISIGFFIYLNLNRLNKGLRILFFLIFSGTFMYIVQSFFLSGSKAFNYTQMVKPRLDLYYIRLLEFYDNSIFLMLFGYKNDWAKDHNTYIDILKHSGILGFVIGLMLLFGAIRKKVDVDIHSEIGKTEYGSVIIFAIFFFIFDNFVNTAFSTPYYTVSCLCLIASIKACWIMQKET